MSAHLWAAPEAQTTHRRKKQVVNPPTASAPIQLLSVPSSLPPSLLPIFFTHQLLYNLVKCHESSSEEESPGVRRFFGFVRCSETL